jgi:hypothetical protein
MGNHTVFASDLKPIGFVLKTLTAGTHYQLPTGNLGDQKTFVVAKVQITIEGDASTLLRYRIDPEALGKSNGHILYDGDSITISNASAVKNLSIYPQAVGAGTILRITFFK